MEGEVMMDRDAAREAFRRSIVPLQHEAESAFIQGRVDERLELWSHEDPVSVFAALGPSKQGWDRLELMFTSVADRLSDGDRLTYDLTTYDVSGDMAWTAGFLRFSVSIDGAPARSMVLRVTHIYRRENGQWKIAHEHSNWED